MTKPGRIIITGGPGSGKSTLLEGLKIKGYSYREEAARKVILEYRKDKINPWNKRERFVKLVYERIFNELHEPSTELIFYDRGLLDCIAYLAEAGLPVPAHYNDIDPRLYYGNEVFILPPWRAIYHQDWARRQSFKQAVSLYQSICKTYLAYGFKLVEVPRDLPQQRVLFIQQFLMKKRNLEWEKI